MWTSPKGARDGERIVTNGGWIPAWAARLERAREAHCPTQVEAGHIARFAAFLARVAWITVRKSL